MLAVAVLPALDVLVKSNTIFAIPGQRPKASFFALGPEDDAGSSGEELTPALTMAPALISNGLDSLETNTGLVDLI
ncbi:hypothetical protein D3C85_1537690 [compost metagenome]